MEATERYMITASCYPPYASKAWKGQRLLVKDAITDTSVEWVIDDNFGAGLTGEGAAEGLAKLRSGVVLYEIRPLETETDLRETRMRESRRGKVIVEEEFRAPERRPADVSPRLSRRERVERPAAPARRTPVRRERERRSDRIYGLHGLMEAFGITLHAAMNWSSTILATAVVGKEGRTKVYDREAAARIVECRRRKAGRKPAAATRDRLLFGPDDVASFLGIAGSTVRQYRKLFEPALAVRTRRVEERVWSRLEVRRIWDAHVAAVHRGRSRITSESRWDRVCPAPDGTVRGTRNAAKLLHCDRRILMRRPEIFAPAVVAGRNGVRLYYAAKLREVWAEHMKDYRRRLSETARRTNERVRAAAVVPEGTVLGNAALADALGCCLGSVCHYLGELSAAKVARYARQWLWDVDVAREIWDGIRKRNAEARRKGIAEYFSRRRLGLGPLRRKAGTRRTD